MKCNQFKASALLCSFLALGACSSSDDNSGISDGFIDENDGMTTYGYAFTRTPTFSAGEIVRISLTDGNTIDGAYEETLSDFNIATDGEALYQIGRLDIDTLTRYAAIDTSLADFDVSVLGDSMASTNPQSIAFLSEDLAYLTRRSSDSLLIIDPTPEQPTEESVISGEISLAAYNRVIDGVTDFPDMTDALVVDNKLFVLLENQDGFAPINQGYIAVIDTVLNEEIDTERGVFPLRGIELNTVNPTSMHFNEDTGLIYVTGRGNSFGNPDVPGDPYTGGIESIDPVTFQPSLLVDDGTAEDNQGFFTDAVVVDETLGYVVTLDGFNADFSAINSLRTFNPMTGEVSDPVAGTEGLSLTNITLAPDDHLWVGIQTDTPGFLRIDIATGIVAEQQVFTDLIPHNNFVFIDVENQ